MSVMECVLCAALSTQYPHTVPYLDMLSHHHIAHNNVTFY
jgi:hypothetical protein